MSRLFDFGWRAGMGYSQPEPLLSKNSIALPPSPQETTAQMA